MTESDLDRVREDLATMRQATGFRLPFGSEQVCVSLALGIVGIAVTALTAWTNVSSRPTMPGSATHWAYIALVVFPVLLVFGVMTAVARRRKALDPLLWRESRLSWLVAAVAVPLYLGFIAWAVKNSIPLGALTAATLFLAGLFLLMGAVTNRSRWYTLGWTASTLLAGVCAPVATYETAGLVAGGWLLLGGLSTASIMAWQLRSRNGHGVH